MSTPLRRAIIDPEAISANVSRLRELAPTENTMVVVKANGYGHGAVTAARAAIAGGANWLGVADITEALELRRAGVGQPVLAWLHSADEDFREAVAAGVAIGASTLEHLDALSQTDSPRVHLKIDTGLGRNGAGSNELAKFFARASELHHAGKIFVDGLMSHVSGTSREADLSQAEEFLVGLGQLAELGIEPEFRHLAASAAAIDHPSLRFNMVRFGIAAYGLAPSNSNRELGLKPAMLLESSLINLKRLRPGDGVSYNHLWRAEKATTVGLVSIGYADGIPRSATGSAEVEINGERFPVVGRIAMDQLVVDLGDKSAKLGDRVGIWGDPAAGTPSADEWADWAGTIGYDLVTGVGRRVSYEVR
jgi:alanine racemase